MARLLVVLDHRENRRLLAEALAGEHEVNALESAEARSRGALASPFDLCVLDGPALDRVRGLVEARRRVEAPIFLPFLLVTSRADASLSTHGVWQVVDELIVAPVERLELRVRVEVLLRARRQSRALHLHAEDRRTVAQALAHELRAPVRSIQRIADELLGRPHLEASDRLDLRHIRAEAGGMQDLMDSLVRFFLLGSEAVEARDVPLEAAVEEVLAALRPEIERREARVDVRPPLPAVRADATLLRIVLRNLVSGALDLGGPGARLELTAERHGECCRIQVRRIGTGEAAAPAAPERSPGLELGLATARKAAELMDGRLVVAIAPGGGCSFRAELPAAGWPGPSASG
jgi:signal transduction histidine kinase